jgi:hypothetical protein
MVTHLASPSCHFLTLAFLDLTPNIPLHALKRSYIARLTSSEALSISSISLASRQGCGKPTDATSMKVSPFMKDMMSN